MDLSQYQGLIFDMDGTLIDSMPSHMQAWALACEHFGYPFDLSYMNGLGGVPTQNTVVILNKKYGLEHDPKTVATKKRQLWEEMNLVPDLIPSTYAILNQYIGKMPIGVGTGAERSHALEVLGHYGLLEKISTLVTASDVENGKPHPETFMTAAKQMGVAANQCVVFEDTEIGYQAAKAAGMDCILVKNGELYVQ